MFVEDERTLRTIEVQKTYSDKHDVFFALRTVEISGNDWALVQSALQEQVLESLQARDGSIVVLIRCKRPTNAADACRVLGLMFAALASTAESTYHIYFDSKSDNESARGRFEEILNDPSTSAFRKEAAAMGLRKLDEKLARKRRPADLTKGP